MIDTHEQGHKKIWHKIITDYCEVQLRPHQLVLLPKGIVKQHIYILYIYLRNRKTHKLILLDGDNYFIIPLLISSITSVMFYSVFERTKGLSHITYLVRKAVFKLTQNRKNCLFLGLDIPDFPLMEHRQTALTLDAYNSRDKKINILAFGSISARKNIEGLTMIAKNHSDILQVTLLGSGSCIYQHKEAVSVIDAEFSDSTLFEYLSSADAIWANYTNFLGSSNVVSIADALNIPCITHAYMKNYYPELNLVSEAKVACLVKRANLLDLERYKSYQKKLRKRFLETLFSD